MPALTTPNSGPDAIQAQRIWFKVHTEYKGDFSSVKDCARISLEFATAEGLERAAKFVLQSASTFKNRVANPTDEGYRDLMFTVLIENHVCEVSKRRAAPLGAPFAALPPAAHHGALHGMWGLGGVAGDGVGRWRFGGAGVGGGKGGVAGCPRRRSLTQCPVRRRRRCSCTWSR